MRKRQSAMTLMELLVALSIFGFMILGIAAFDIFTKTHVIAGSRLTQAQNDASFMLEHIGKWFTRASGNEARGGANSVVYVSTASGITSVLSVYIDSLIWSGYRYDSTTRTVDFCSNCTDATCGTCSATRRVLSNRVTRFLCVKPVSPTNLLNDVYVNLELETCFDPPAGNCGTTMNPTVTMRSKAMMPSVGTH
jgi:prepilin-type N-terminal cleavage/methylation domain-containing protein